MASDQICYTLIGLSTETKTYTEQKLKEDLQNGKDNVKREALKELIRLIINGEKFPNLLMIVIRFVMPSQDHMIKKLLLLFWEVVPKYGSDGKLLQEMILVCDAYRKDLQHPNEFIRGSTLRFLCKLKEPELLEPIMPSIQQCLEHRHAYVRRNAVLAIFTIYKNFESLIPDAPQKILRFLEQEQDSSCKRNAFMMLLHVSQSTALDYLTSCLDEVQQFGDILQLIVVELIYKVCLAKPSERLRFIRCIYSLLQSNSAAVRYEAAGTLTTLSSAPSAIKAAASCYINLILKESDNNVKLIVLSRLTDLRQYHERILQDLIMDIVQIINASDMEVRRKTLNLTIDLVTARTAEEVIKIFRKELIKACSTNTRPSAPTSVGEKSSGDDHNSDESVYRYSLVHTIYDICVRFPEVLPTIVPTICEILTYEEVNDTRAANEACKFLREILERFPQRKADILEKLMQIFPSVVGRETLRHLLWIFGEYCTTYEEINSFMTLVRQVIGELPLVDEELRRQGSQVNSIDSSTENRNQPSVLISGDINLGVTSAQRVTADGTYATQSALTLRSNKDSGPVNGIKRPVLQAALFESHYFPGVVLSVCLVKLFYRYSLILKQEQMKAVNKDESTNIKIVSKENSFAAECMLIIASMIHLATSQLLPHQVNPDHLDRMWICLKILADRRAEVLEAFERTSHSCLTEMLTYQESERKSDAKTRNQGLIEHQKQLSELNRADAPIKFSLLTGHTEFGDTVDRFDLTLSQALGSGGKGNSGDAYATSKLSKVHQLTGFSDPVYAEAYVHVNQFDILLDVLVVNQTRDTLQNLTLELSTLGDLRLVEKPSPLTIAPQDFANIKANIKVSSTENGIIFGNISYDIHGSSGETTCIVLNDIHIDIMEYIMPATCTPSEFRQMWSEFEWENKVTVNTQIKDLFTYLSQITSHTNLRCLTPTEALLGDCDYLCVTLYAKTIFGEHVLANLCLEKSEADQPVTGHVRIRAKTQGMAVTMGERVSSCQKNWPVSNSQTLNDNGEKHQNDEDTNTNLMRSHSPVNTLLNSH
ncbi:Coatomer subunit beta [Schistosoma japonicum]|uniref:Coatomer subunit beta n=3 Tax=Schistosoma japonicum TaxID=6182 RepID=C1L5F7_SCHJA|nr:Coatomer subunit beta [Schistosoma japonicum]CAX69935.1 Coatomer subunit beta [Schistosoma japonicum]CAX74223.1 Coatomer subunit beta [Schistosoma japonicum]